MLLLLLLLLLLLASSIFGSPAGAEARHEGIAMHGAPKYGDGFAHFDYVNPDAPKVGTLRLSANGTFDSLNPFIVRGQPAAYLTLVYESLMARSWDEPFSLYGLLAESVEVADDRSSIIFTLRPAAHWSDGVPVTADDILFSFNLLRSKGRPNHRTYYKKVIRAEKLGPRSVKFTFAAGATGAVDREMPLIMGLMPILPEHDWTHRDFDRTTWQIPVGSGPYKIEKVDPGRSITYSRDKNYWGGDVPAQIGLNNFDTVHIDYYRDEGISLEAFKAGQYDLRRESNPNRWATAYDFPAARDGRVRRERLEHHRPEPIEGFVFNTRRPPFSDAALRSALEYSFDAGWINQNLFHGQYHRSDSFFPNSELAAPTLPEGRELEILGAYREQLPPEIFTAAVTPPSTDGSEAALRDNLLRATDILQKAGYVWRDGKLYGMGDTQIAFEILLNDPLQEKVALTWTRALARLGIAARVHTVDSSQYQARLANSDFDVTVNKWINTLSPGNEQSIYWSSEAANQPGSRNYAGVRDPVVDALASAIPASTTREELVATTHALDRVLMAGHYVIPFYYLGADNFVYWAAHLHHPMPPPLCGSVQESWWLDPEGR
ncbi:MAG: extracellular solute-binding protein [Pseudomonadota bacterium]|nr:extracellular solute-binding protein [Pseudomonadota bacterium]